MLPVKPEVLIQAEGMEGFPKFLPPPHLCSGEMSKGSSVPTAHSVLGLALSAVNREPVAFVIDTSSLCTFSASS